MKYYLKNMIFVSNSECGYTFLKELTAGGGCSVNELYEKFLPPIIRILFHFSKNGSPSPSISKYLKACHTNFGS